MQTDNLARPVAVGALAGLVATVIMDVFGIGLFLVLGTTDVNPFAIIGDAAAGGLALVGVELAGGAWLGAVCHYLIGPALGGVWGALVARIDALRLASAVKAAGLGILYVDLASLPLLAGAAVILKMTPSGTAMWFGMSFVIHMVYGGCLGLIVRYGLRPSAVAHPA